MVGQDIFLRARDSLSFSLTSQVTFKSDGLKTPIVKLSRVKSRYPLLYLRFLRLLYLALLFEVLGPGTEPILKVKWQVPPASPSPLSLEEVFIMQREE